MSERLFHLIKSMNRSEKIHFTKDYAGKNNVLYLDLYKAYQKSEKYEKAEIEKSLKKKWPDKNLRQATIYLESAVINSLATSVKSDSLHAQIEETKREIKVFRSKGLYKEHFKSVEKVVQLTKDSPEILDYLKHLNSTVFYNITHLKATKDDPYYKDLLNIMEELPAYFKSIIHYFNAYRKLTVSGDLQNGESKEKYYKIVSELNELLNASKHPASKVYFSKAKFVYACILNDKKIAFQSAFENIELYESSEKFKIMNESRYHGSYISLLILIEHHEDPLKMANEIREKISLIKNENQETHLMRFCADLIHLKVALNNAKKEEQKVLLKELEERYLNSVLPWPKDLRAYILSLFISISFILEDYKHSLEWIELFEDQNYKDFRQDLCINIKFLTILNHYELGNDLLLPYYIKHTYRFISKYKSLNAQESWILNAIRKVSKHGFKRSQIKILKLDYNQKLAEEHFIENSILNMNDWLESKLENKSYLEVREIVGTKKALV